MVDVEIGGDRHVELVEDQVLDQMPGKLGMALDHRHLARAPAFVSGLELFGHTHHEGGVMVQRHRCRVIIEHDDVHIRHILGVPGADRLEPLEQLDPVILVRLAVIHRGADAGHMRCPHSGDQSGHVSSPLSSGCLRSGARH